MRIDVHRCRRGSVTQPFLRVLERRAREDKYYNKQARLAWWDALQDVYEKERAVWRGFVGEHPDPASNRQYAIFREVLLKGEKMKANA